MGFGHRVYKNSRPPRLVFSRTACATTVLESTGPSNAHAGNRAGSSKSSRAATTSYFVERKLYPNVDFYSGIIYQATRRYR